MRTIARTLTCLFVCAAAVLAPDTRVHAAEKKNFKVAWTIYVGWMPWDYANQSGTPD